MEDDYKDISEVMAESRLSKHSISIQELSSSMTNLTRLINDIFEMFKTASEQMKLEDKENAHEQIIAKLDTIIEQNKAIAAGIVSLAEIARQNREAPKPAEGIQQPQMQKNAPPIIPQFRQQPMPSIQPPNIYPPVYPPQSGMQPPSFNEPIGADMIGNLPEPDFELPELEEPLSFDEERKKPGLFGRLKKK